MNIDQKITTKKINKKSYQCYYRIPVAVINNKTFCEK